MTSHKLNRHLHLDEQIDLISNGSFDRVESINKKPTIGVVGSTEKNPNSSESVNGISDNAILTDEPNLCKQSGAFVNSDYNFIKLCRSEKVDWLIQNFPKAFLLLTVIARQARRTNDSIDGLQPGDAIIGRFETSKKAGISQKDFRIALEKLENLKIIEIVYNEKWNHKKTCEKKIEFSKVQKRANKRSLKRAIKSIIVNLCDRDVYDINIDDQGQQKKESRANKGPTEGHKRRNEKERKEDIRLKRTNKKKNFVDSSFSSLSNNNFKKRNYAQEDVEVISLYCIDKKIDVKEKVIGNWLSKYEPELIFSNLAILIDQKSRGLKIRTNDEAWMESALKKNYKKFQDNVKLNKLFTEKFKLEKQWSELKILEKYATLERESIDFQFDRDPDEHARNLIEKYKNHYEV